MKRVMDGMGRVDRAVLAEMKKIHGTHALLAKSRF